MTKAKPKGCQPRSARIAGCCVKWMKGRASHGDIVGREAWHIASRAGGLRAAVFGINDGLVSNFSLVMGFAGAEAKPEYIFLAGCAGLLAGSFSMAAGEYVSVRAQRELFEQQIAMEQQELEMSPKEEEEELALIYQAKGIAEADARMMARRIVENPRPPLTPWRAKSWDSIRRSSARRGWPLAVRLWRLFSVRSCR